MIASLSEKDGVTDISVKQENFEAYLLPGEEIRSPLVSLSFYNNKNPLKGFNLFRNWISDSVYPENVTKNSYTVMEVAGPTSTRTSDEIIEILNGIDDSIYNQTDAFWMDAGWYEYNEGETNVPDLTDMTDMLGVVDVAPLATKTVYKEVTMVEDGDKYLVDGKIDFARFTKMTMFVNMFNQNVLNMMTDDLDIHVHIMQVHL